MLDFENSEAVNINMTSLQGKITTTYDKLVEVFGEPTMTDASPYEKVNAQWMLEFKVPFVDKEYGDDFDYVTATIYNWKDGYIPMEEYDWHIGGFHGHGANAVDAVQKCLDSV